MSLSMTGPTWPWTALAGIIRIGAFAGPGPAVKVRLWADAAFKKNKRVNDARVLFIILDSMLVTQSLQRNMLDDFPPAIRCAARRMRILCSRVYCLAFHSGAMLRPPTIT